MIHGQWTYTLLFLLYIVYAKMNKIVFKKMFFYKKMF